MIGEYTPTRMAQHLIGYITDDGAVAAYVKSHFGRDYPVSRVKHLRDNAPAPSVPFGFTAKAQGIAHGSPVEANAARAGSQRLLRALARYHFNHAEADEAKAYWHGLC